MVDYEDVLSHLYSQRELIEHAIRTFEILTARRRKRGRPAKRDPLVSIRSNGHSRHKRGELRQVGTAAS
jgi:hypothetical protein